LKVIKAIIIIYNYIYIHFYIFVIINNIYMYIYMYISIYMYIYTNMYIYISGNLFQSLVLISQHASKVSTKGLGCVFWPDAEWLDSRGPWCNLFLAPGIILKGLLVCMRSNRRDITLCAPFDPSRTLARCWKGCLGRCLVEFDACVHSLRPWYIDSKKSQACAEASIQSDYLVQWCVRCFLMKESPKTPGHYRYLIVGPWLHPLYGISGVQFAISRVPVCTAISNCFSLFFQHLRVGVACN